LLTIIIISIQGTPQQMYLNYYTTCLNSSSNFIIT